MFDFGTAGLIIALLMIWIFTSVAKKYKKRQGMAPTGMQGLFEPVFLFVRDPHIDGKIGGMRGAIIAPRRHARHLGNHILQFRRHRPRGQCRCPKCAQRFQDFGFSGQGPQQVGNFAATPIRIHEKLFELGHLFT